MRIRLQLLAPFEESKALVLLPEDVRTIQGVKRHIRQSLSTVLALTNSPKDLLLEIDGFELLPGSSVDIIESSEVVTVRLRAGSSRQELGIRKRSSSREGGQVKKRKVENGGSVRPTSSPEQVIVPPRASSPALSTSSSSSSSSSETASSSNSSSSATVSSSSSSSSSSADSSDTGPSVTTIPPFPLPPASLVLSATKPTDHVIPGHGKITTKERNQRRRFARRMKQQAEQNGRTETSGTREGARTVIVPTTNLNGESNGDTITTTQSELPVPRAMANRNKKKGFLREMANVQGTKTVFGADAQGSSTPVRDLISSTTNSTPHATPNRSATWTQSRVIPPSELETLPSNVFVTHVEYPRNGWTPRQRNQRGGQSSLVDNTTTPVEGGTQVEVEGNMDEEELLNDDMTVNHREISDTPAFSHTEAFDDADDDVWTIADTRFDSLPTLAASSLPTESAVLAWKELQLDPYTFTPQLVVQLGKLKSLSSESVVVERMERYEPDEEDAPDAQEPDLVITLSELHNENGKYRIVKSSS